MTSPRSASRPIRWIPLSLIGETEEATAAGVYGVIVSAAVMASSHAETAAAVIVAVLVTLTIYWSAERFSRLVAGRIAAAPRPTWRQVRRQMTTGWEIVTTSALPLMVLSGLRLVGLDLDRAITVALMCSTVLLGLAGWEMSRNGGFSTLERLAAATVAGMFGVLLIALKAALH